MLRQRLGSGYASSLSKSNSTHLHQEKLHEALTELFPEHDILQNVRKHANLISPATHAYLELDAWIPALNLAFEFQDPHHYVSTWYENAPLASIRENDSMKKMEAERLGITLVPIPCWWDGSTPSLVGTIKSHKSTLLPTHTSARPIPVEPPQGFFTVASIEGVGQPMLASFPESSKESLFEDTKWWMGEKYDGMRAIWSPKAKSLYSRHAKIIAIPNIFTKWLPNVFLDLELWFGRENFTEILLNERKERESESEEKEETKKRVKWQWGRGIILDYPASEKHKEEYEERYKVVMENIEEDNPFAIFLSCHQIISKKHVHKNLRMILESGGEGIVLRKNKSTYQPGRTDSLLKLKAARDEEGVVLEIHKDSYSMQLRDGKIVSARVPKNRDPLLLKIGDVATLSYAGPNQFVIDRKREDVEWNFEFPATRIENKPSQNAFLRSPVRPRGYWTVDGNKNIRKFLDNLAKSKNLDPLLPETWYKIPLRELRFQQKGEEWPLYHYSSASVKALMDIYPEIGLDESKFTSARKSHWKVQRNRKLFFDKFAEKQGFSANVPSNWYHVNKKLVLKQTGGGAILKHFESLSAALMDAYPNLAFDLSKFTTRPPKNTVAYWKIRSARREFFDEISRKKKFDPLIASNWYSLRSDDVFAERGASSLLGYYDHSVINGLIDVYPTVTFDETKFAALPMSFYKIRANRRKFFDSFAHEHGFDPLKKKTWNQYLDLILKSKGGRTILSQYGTAPTTNLLRALRDVYSTNT